MKIILQIMILLIITFGFNGCLSSNNTYVFPKQDKNNKSTIIGSSTSSGLFQWKSFRVLYIDNKYISYGLFSNKYDEFISLKDGLHTIIIEGKFNRGYADGPYNAYAKLELKALKNKRYKVMGKIEGINIEFWIIDSDTGEVLTSITKSEYREQAAPLIIFI